MSGADRRGRFVRLTAALPVLALLFCLAPTAFAATASFSSDAVTAQEGRLLAVPVRVRTDAPLAAASFTFSYNASVLEFRECTSGDTVVCCDERGTVRVSWLCEGGVSGGGEVFALHFKAVSAGGADLSFTVSDCVDWNADAVSAGACTAGAVEVTGRSAAEKATAATKAPKASTAPPTYAPSDAEAARSAASTVASTNGGKTLDFVNTADEADGKRLYAPFVIASGSVIAAAFIVFLTVRLFQKKKTTGKNE